MQDVDRHYKRKNNLIENLWAMEGSILLWNKKLNFCTSLNVLVHASL
jgi:hypothetical protein